jgi:hypothetical protein
MYPHQCKLQDYMPPSAPSICIRQPGDQTLANFPGDCRSTPPIFRHHSVLLSQYKNLHFAEQIIQKYL